MKTLRSLAELNGITRPIHWAMGFFDGVHAGHRRIIDSTATPGALRGVLTFSPHPAAVLAPERAPLLLTPDAEYKAQLLQEAGAEVLLTLPFTRELAATPALDFLEQLHAACPIAGVSVGTNWRFGRGGSGNPALLRQFAAARSIRTCVHELATLGEEIICSTRIRQLIAAGQLDTAAAMLGRSFCIPGAVEHGQQLARRLGFPTANIPIPHDMALPPYGVYAVRCLVGGTTYHGIANLGLRPTVDNTTSPRLEVHLLHFHGDLYGQRLHTELLRFLRPEQRFDSIDALKAQIQRDLAML